MRSGPPLARYQAEVAHALSRLQLYRARGDEVRAAEWHRTWSLAADAVDAECLQKGAGAGVLRRGTPSTLRPLPPEPEPAPTVSTPEISGEKPTQAASPLPPAGHLLPIPERVAADFAAALERHGRIDRALQAGGPNPFPDELGEGEWQYHLTAFRVDGPLDCEFLQQAEAAVEALVEAYPELLPPEEEEAEIQPGSARKHAGQDMLPECLRIYQESLSDLSEDDLRADLDRCLEAGRAETAALIEAELRQRERETAPDLQHLTTSAPTFCSGETQNRKSVNAPAGISEARGSDSPPEGIRTSAPAHSPSPPQRPRRRTAVYSTTADPVAPPAAPKQSRPASVDAVAPTAPAYTTAPAWIDAAGRTRTWSLLDPSGAKLADVTTRRDAEKLAALLTRVMARPATPSP